MAAFDVAQLRVSDGMGNMRMMLPPELREKLMNEAAELRGDEGDGDGEQQVEMRMSFSNSSGPGWNQRMVNHPSAGIGDEPDEHTPVVDVSVPMRSPALGDAVTLARLKVSVWWDQDAGAWTPTNVTFEDQENEDNSGARDRLREVFH